MGTKGVQRIDTVAVGADFDPNVMEAMSVMPCPGEDAKPGSIANVWQVSRVWCDWTICVCCCSLAHSLTISAARRRLQSGFVHCADQLQQPGSCRSTLSSGVLLSGCHRLLGIGRCLTGFSLPIDLLHCSLVTRFTTASCALPRSLSIRSKVLKTPCFGDASR